MLKMNTSIFFLFATLLCSGISLSQEWQTDFEKAKLMAKEGQKPIVLVFQGSDWCAPCIKLDHEIWSTTVFKTYAKDHYIMLQADFPRKKKNALSKEQTLANNSLAEKYNKRGIFPLVVLLDDNGTALGSTSYKKISPKDYILELNKLLE